MPKLTFIAAWRKRHKISQRAAEELLGCSRSAVIHWERGLHKTPRYIILAIKALMDGHRVTGDE